MRFLLDERNLDPDVSLRCFRVLLVWAMTRGDRFVLRLDRGAYTDLDYVSRLCALGQVTKLAAPEVLGGWIDRLLAKLFSGLVGMVEVQGTPGETLRVELTSREAPVGMPGDVCPVEDLFVFTGERRIYAVYDYGRDQILDLTDDELNDLVRTFCDAHLDPNRVIPAPPYSL